MLQFTPVCEACIAGQASQTIQETRTEYLSRQESIPAPHPITTLLSAKRLHPGVVEASGDRVEIAGRVHVMTIEQGHGEMRSIAHISQPANLRAHVIK